MNFGEFSVNVNDLGINIFCINIATVTAMMKIMMMIVAATTETMKVIVMFILLLQIVKKC